ncbi:MAG: SPASM domain-containing protein [Candidatus Diapherotrites archaeon]
MREIILGEAVEKKAGGPFFSFKYGGKRLVFAPKRNRLFLLEKGEHLPESGKVPDKCKELQAMDLLEGCCRPPNYGGITFLLNTTCNLGCLYCYADKGNVRQSGIMLNKAKAFSAIDFVRERFPEGKKEFDIFFHGRGEPTLELGLMESILGYSRKKFKKVNVSLISNGVFGKKALDWILKNADSLAVSCCGLPEIQDRLRPLRSGGPSSKIVEKNLKALVGAGKKVSIKCYLDSEATQRMDEIVEYFSTLGVATLFLAPISETACSEKHGVEKPEMGEFQKRLLQAIELADRRDLMVQSSILQVGEIKHIPCGVLWPQIVVTPSGNISACNSLITLDDLRFYYGKIGKEIVLDFEKVGKWRKELNPEKICKGCFLRWSCAGGCYARECIKEKGHYRLDRKLCRLKRDTAIKYFKYLVSKECNEGQKRRPLVS